MSQEMLETIAEGVLDGMVDAVKKGVQAAIDGGLSAKVILDEGLIAGMDEVGALFKEGEMFVPEVLVSAKAMQAGMELIKPLLLADGVKTAGTVLTVTVEGDLHDIGIKLVGMMLEGAGFQVINMGVDVPTAAIIEKVKEVKPDILGLSAMLTTTMANMRDVVDALKEEGLFDGLKVMVGGAPTSPDFARKVGVHYAADANEAVTVAKQLLAA
jgi:5-methyltetrahydrofolate--homocysteine methyltransferase